MKTEALLKEHSLRVTRSRIAILEIFLNFEFALSYMDIEKKLPEKLDKVTIYRTLKSFEDNGLIHQVIDNSHTIKYALCSHTCDTVQHQDNHVHFKCETCEHTYCLEGIKISIPKIPEKYYSKKYDLLIQGICAACIS